MSTSMSRSRSRCWRRTGPATRTYGTGSSPRHGSCGGSTILGWSRSTTSAPWKTGAPTSSWTTSTADRSTSSGSPASNRSALCGSASRRAGRSRSCTAPTSSIAMSRPGNLLLSTGPDGQPRVLIADLGVAKSMIDAVGATMTAGTPSYMAPEQAAGNMQLDRRADIYSLTAVSYAMLTGKAPFPVRSIADILARDPGLQPEPVAARLNAPPTLDAVMISGLAYDRNRRPPTALLLADGLQTIAAQLEASASGTWSTISTIGGSMAPRTAPPVMPPPPPPESTIVTSPGSQPSTPPDRPAATVQQPRSAIHRVRSRIPEFQGRPVQGPRHPGPAPAIRARRRRTRRIGRILRPRNCSRSPATTPRTPTRTR